MSLSRDESRALAFVALLLLLAAAARVVGREPAVQWAGDAVDIDSLTAEARERLESIERRSRPLEEGERLDPNTATDEELDRLPGVGPALARRIVAEREAGGPFRSLEDLMRVRGIGPSALERLAPHLTLPITGPTVGGRSRIEYGPTVDPGRPWVTTPGRGADTRGRAAGSGAVRGAGTQIIDLNRATAAELQTLSGIGPALAARIIAFRDSVGGFRTVDELERVRGIGPATVERLRPLVRVKP